MTDGGTTPGWYYAEGDPPGTQRYWNGASWDGEPVPATAGGAAPSAGAPGAVAKGSPPAGRVYAEWGSRAAAWLIDGLLMFALFIPLFILGAVAGAISDGLGVAVFWLGYLAIIAFGIYLMAYLQGVTGQTPGKRIMGIEVVRKDNGQYMGGGLGVGRYFLRAIIGGICFLEYLWPLWDADNQTLTDKILSTVVVKGNKGGLLPMFPDGKPF